MSIKQVGLSVAAVVLTASLAACGQGQPQSSAASNGGVASQPVASAANVAGAMLMVQPATVDGCNPNQPVVATVSWHSREPSVKVTVQGPGHDTPQLFSESGYSGSAKTGDWVTNGTKFTLISAPDGHVLAEQTVGVTPCSNSHS